MDTTTIACTIWAVLYSKYDFYPVATGGNMCELLRVYENVKSNRKRGGGSCTESVSRLIISNISPPHAATYSCRIHQSSCHQTLRIRNCWQLHSVFRKRIIATITLFNLSELELHLSMFKNSVSTAQVFKLIPWWIPAVWMNRQYWNDGTFLFSCWLSGN